MVNTIWIKQISKEDIPLVGGKAANLGELSINNFPVPNGFIVTSNAYKLFLQRTGIQVQIDEILNNTDINDFLKNSPSLEILVEKFQKNLAKTA